MIYVDTHRDFWRARLTIPKFFGTALLLGTTTAAAVLSVFHVASDAARISAIAAMIIRTMLFAWEAQSVDAASARIVTRFRQWLPGTRLAFFVLSSIAGFAAIALPHPVAAVLALVSTFASQVLERYCFFRRLSHPPDARRSSDMKGLAESIGPLLRQREGPLTEELVGPLDVSGSARCRTSSCRTTPPRWFADSAPPVAD
jgi:hypothetical protein